jgi:hypothetical protein
MKYKPYPTKKTVPQRRARKVARNEAFNYNKYGIRLEAKNAVGK